MERDQCHAIKRRDQADSADEVIAIIPARGGSRGIPKKNLVVLGNYSLLEHTIADAYGLRCPIYVTTDDPMIGNIAEWADAVYIKRPDEISGDHASIEDAVKNALEWLSAPRETIVVLLQCTSPFRQPGELASAMEYFRMGYCDSLYSAYALQQFVWAGDKRVQYPVDSRPVRQNKEPLYVEDGSFYISRAWCYYENNNRLAGRIGRWVHDKIYGLEVDSWDDLKCAQTLLKWLKSSGKV